MNETATHASAEPLRVVHYLNQFFGGLGGEAMADTPLQVQPGPVGPGRLLHSLLAPQAAIVATVICGDNTVQREAGAMAAQALQAAKEYAADVLVAGPAFQSGRYGLACATVAATAYQDGLPALAAMHPENPGVSFCPPGVPVVIAGDSAAEMREALLRMAPVALALARGEPLDPAAAAGCLVRSARRNRFADHTAARRAVTMLLDRLAGRSFVTELPRPHFGSVVPAAPIEAAQARIALITSGGIVPRGNPDRLESSTATKWVAYSIAGYADLRPEEFECVHAGFDSAFANLDPDRVTPLDVCRELEAEGKIGMLDDTYYATVGNLTPIASAERFAGEIAGRLRATGVQGVILTAT